MHHQSHNGVSIGRWCAAAWLDIKMEKLNEAAMKEATQNSKCIIAIISGTERNGDPADTAYFNRQFCVNELRWARAANVPIQPVVAAEDKGRIGEFLEQAPDDLKDLGAIDFIHLDRSRPAYVAAQGHASRDSHSLLETRAHQL